MRNHVFYPYYRPYYNVNTPKLEHGNHHKMDQNVPYAPINNYLIHIFQHLCNKPYWSSVRGKHTWINKLRRPKPGSDFYEIKNAK